MDVRRLVVESPIGPLTLLADDDGLRRIYFETEEIDAEFDDAEDTAGDEVLAEAARQLGEYFAGSRVVFNLPLHLEGTNFERESWRALASIPYGQTISYGEQADFIGRHGASRAVGGANGRNPLPIVLPCHRVVGSDGSLTGFGGGIRIKRFLLDHEAGVQRLPF